MKPGKPAKRAKGRTQQSRTAARDKCDDLFSKLIRERDGWCQRCGSTEYLQCAHIIRRRYFGIRCSADNALALCRSCHTFFDVGKRDVEWEMWVRERIGFDALENLRRRGLETPTPDWFEVLEKLRKYGLTPPPESSE